MPTTEVAKDRTPSLLEISQSLQMLMQDREETQDPEELAAIDAAIQEYVAKEIGKVDRIRGYIRYAENKVLAAKQAAAEATSYAQIWQNRIERVRAASVTAMETTGVTRLEGTAGSLSIRKNGGKQPLKVENPELLPDECCRMEGWISADLWEVLRARFPHYCSGIDGALYQFNRVPDNEAIRAKLAEPCPACGGHPELIVPMLPGEAPGCSTCGGSGKNAVPGAYLAERGTSLVVR